MPHLRLEYTGNLVDEIEPDEILPELHGTLARVADVAIENCKSRAIRLDDYHVGAGGELQSFVHLEIRIFEGRTVEEKQVIGERCLAVLESHLAPALAELDLQLTVEVLDIERSGYFKAAKPVKD